MARFYFHLLEADQRVDDEQGIDLPHLDAAHAFAVENTRDIIAAAVKRGELPLSHSLQIADEAGNVVRTVSFGETVMTV